MSASSIVARLQRIRDAAATLPSPEPTDWSVLDDQHPLAQAFGLEKARAILDGLLDEQQAKAEHRLREVERLSREGRLVREIAAELSLSYNHVVALRAQLGVGRQR